MNEATISPKTRFSTLVSQVATWLFNSSLQRESGEDFRFRTFRCKLGGGLLSFSLINFRNPDQSGIQICFGFIRFHYDVDLIFIPRPEAEIRNDRRINKFAYKDNAVNYHSWFLGFEGIGIYHKSSLTLENMISAIEIGAHPLISIGFYNVYHEITQHAIIGIQVINLQVSFHAAFDKKLKHDDSHNRGD
jgi:uncharacterized membrane protein